MRDVAGDDLRPDKCPRCHLRPTWAGDETDEPLCWECFCLCAALSSDSCGWCGYRHDPRRISCTEVQGRIDGVSVGNPEGGAGWALPTPLMATADSETDEEWAW